MKTLKPGDKVRIIAPGKGIPNAWEVLEKCCTFLKKFDLEPVYTNRIFANNDSYYDFANTDEERFLDFVDALQSDAQAIWCFRGGYGSDRILKRFHPFPKENIQPKLFIGFSDVTNLHSYLQRHLKWQTLHASVLKQFGLEELDSECVNKTMDIVFGRLDKLDFSLIPLNSAAKNNFKTFAKVVGGNLTTLQCAIATPWHTHIDGSFVFLEDVDEAPYRIARILQQFLSCNYFHNAKAILLGDFIPHEHTHTEIIEFALSCPLPVFRCEQVGHGSQNWPLPLNTTASIEQNKLTVMCKEAEKLTI